jgi:hypothetical protein
MRDTAQSRHHQYVEERASFVSRIQSSPAPVAHRRASCLKLLQDGHRVRAVDTAVAVVQKDTRPQKSDA